MCKTMGTAKKEKSSKKERKTSLMEKWKTLLQRCSNFADTGKTQRRFPLSHRLYYDYQTLTKTGHFICYENRTS